MGVLKGLIAVALAGAAVYLGWRVAKTMCQAEFMNQYHGILQDMNVTITDPPPNDGSGSSAPAAAPGLVERAVSVGWMRGGG